MIDRFKLNDNPLYEALISPITETHTFVPSDTEDETELVRGFHCNQSGNITVLLEGNDTPVTLLVLSGNYYPYRVKRLYATDYSAIIVGVL